MKQLAKPTPMTPLQRWSLAVVVLACAAYLGLTLGKPPSDTPSPYHFSVVLVAVLTISIIGLLFLTWLAGYYAWLQLDRYTRGLTAGPSRQAFGLMTQGVWLLAVGLILSSLTGAVSSFFGRNIGLVAVLTQVNYYIIIFFPFFGFMKLQMGSRHLAVAAQAAMTTRAKLVTVGPPVAVLAAFYVFLAATNAAPSTQVLAAGPVGFVVLWLTAGLTIGSWALGLLAALNVERATYRGEGTQYTRPLVGLYNGILTTTGGFIILDALLSLGTTRLEVLPVGALLLLLYGFIGVVGLGFWVTAVSVRRLTAPLPKAEG